MGLKRGVLARVAVSHLSVLLVLVLLGTPGLSGQDPPSPADDLPAASGDRGDTDDKVRCPDCNSEGKMPCPSCGGKGELSHACETCRGGGRKPCPVCSKEVKGDGGASAGRLTCDYCGGKGTTGSQGKACPRCLGTQYLGCTTCGGKGTVACRKVVVDRVCPACKFVGRVPCTTCEGTLLVAPAVILARRIAEKKAARAAGSAEPGPANGSSGSGQASATAVVKAAVSHAELAARYGRLTETYESHLDIFAEDPKPRLEPVRREASQLLKQIPVQIPAQPPLVQESTADSQEASRNAGPGDPAARNGGPGAKVGDTRNDGNTRNDAAVRADLEAFIDRLAHFQRRWGEIRAIFDRERQSFVKVKAAWDSRGETLAQVPAYQKDEVDGELNARLDIALRISEKHSDALADEQPSWLSKELEEISVAWTSLKKRAEAEAAEAARRTAVALKAEGAKREKKPIANGPANGSVSGSARPTAGGKPRGNQPSGAEGPRDLALGSGSGSGGSAARGGGRSSALSADEVQDDAGSREAEEPGTLRADVRRVTAAPPSLARPAGASDMRSVLWALAGFGAAVLLFVLAGLRSRRAEPEENAPPAIS